MRSSAVYASFAPAVAFGLLAACASPAVPEPESVAEKESAAAVRAAESTPPPPTGPEPVRDKIVVVEEGGAPETPSLAEAAAAARAARAADAGSQAPPRRITNDNLAELAREGRVTFAGPDAGVPLAGADGERTGPAAGASAGATDEAGASGTSGGTSGAGGGPAIETAAPAAEPAPADAAVSTVRDEAYWRRRARELRTEWRETVDEITELRERNADLRWRFYAEDDPWVRDSRIKPAWDEAIERLRRAERTAETFPERIDALLDEGRRAGALPGWLREGIELEPARAGGEDEPNPAEPVEPVIVDETGEGRSR